MASFISLVALATLCMVDSVLAQRPNVILILTDDQDLHLNSLDYMPTLQRELVSKGTSFANHFATVAVCCPSRVSYLRGQAVHNTNNTHVSRPGGGYDKFRASGEDLDYLPDWVRANGYRAEYIGKFLNGVSTSNYMVPPRGWDHIDTLLEPYVAEYNIPVFSQNGQIPVTYTGMHQTDVIRVKALDRLRFLVESDEPFFLNIAPYAPHTSRGWQPPVPAARHEQLFTNVSVPRRPNWNPADCIQKGKGFWLKDYPRMNATQEEYADWHHQRRLQSLMSVDELIEDVVIFLDEAGQLNNTFIVYTSDNGYHIGAHRIPAGKALPYVMDTNVPLIVRGPGVPENSVSTVASSHFDLAPTFLDIMGHPNSEFPPLLDGRSLLEEWTEPSSRLADAGSDAKEIINIEFWGYGGAEAPIAVAAPVQTDNSFKTLRIVSEGNAWLYIRWCNNDLELYNSTADPWEVRNLALGTPTPQLARVLNRLNTLLLVTKSCEGNSCRDPWSLLQPPNATTPVRSLADALSPAYDDFFAAFPLVHFNSCMAYQDEGNERPFYPPGAENGLGKTHRLPTPNFQVTEIRPGVPLQNAGMFGGPEQRQITFEEMNSVERELTREELGDVEIRGEASDLWHENWS
ncbi:hypothetical protein S40285_09308 [Stachybotrys chlorohalonatus IBT 40285]|uniref:Sulfatase N-terminal domain-containing protein n=1 Tax=Stachybotrys chlorohalonatus (strain IBT 40285) TaxID=1283841 RepID=A0A084QLZ7_STAC4|nr:hypothetical protein S40285_09308 [Stachybotrys chlorohalonata IBT 40285]